MLEKKLAETPISKILPSQGVKFCKADASLDYFVTTLRDHRIGSLVVVDDDCRPIGILTERDYLMKCAKKDYIRENMPVGALMTKNPIGLPLNSSVASVLKMMSQHEFRHVVLTHDSGKLAGIISIKDILTHLVEWLEH